MRIRHKKKRKVAVFDIDGTFFRSSLLIELVEALITKGFFPKGARRMYHTAYEKWLNRRGSYKDYIMAVVTAFERYLAGVHENDFMRVVREVVAFHEERVYRYTRELLRSLRKRRYFLLAISHSPKYVVDAFAKRWGFDKAYGRMFFVDTLGRFTGESMYQEFIEEKSRIFMRAVEKHNLTLRGSVGVGDTESDISFLKLVRRPICFNPNQSLYRVARRRGWPVVVERKDVIYKLQKLIPQPLVSKDKGR